MQDNSMKHSSKRSSGSVQEADASIIGCIGVQQSPARDEHTTKPCFAPAEQRRAWDVSKVGQQIGEHLAVSRGMRECLWRCMWGAVCTAHYANVSSAECGCCQIAARSSVLGGMSSASKLSAGASRAPLRL